MTSTDAISTDMRAAVEPKPKPAARADDRTDLSGREVLIDTYNLRLRHGSGIKTYGLTLLEALRHLEASITLLGDRNAPAARHQALAEVLFYDRPKPKTRLGRTLRRVSRGLRMVRGRVKPVEIGREFVVPDAPMRAAREVDHIYNAPAVYKAANVLFKRFGRFTKIIPPGRVDLWHATTVLPIVVRGARMITTVHDLIPLRLPYTTLDDKKFFFHLARKALQQSDLVLTVSECSKRDLLRFFDIPEDKIVVTYQSITFLRHEPDERREGNILRRYGLDANRYILFVGNIEPKKNLSALIKAVGSLAECDLPLVVVGRKGWLWKDELAPAKSYFGREDLRARFRLLSYVPSADLKALYANAFCFVFPSLYEGFGLPPLEAMAHGCPVICSNTASLPEVCGDAALYVDPHDPDTIRGQIETLLESPQTRDDLIKRGFVRLEYFSPKRYAERLASAYARVLD